jgi:hypothetical protein
MSTRMDLAFLSKLDGNSLFLWPDGYFTILSGHLIPANNGLFRCLLKWEKYMIFEKNFIEIRSLT